MPNPIFLILIMLITFTGVTTLATGTSITNHVMSPGDVVGETSYIDTLMTNGGVLAINKNVDFDSQNQTVRSYNLQSEKVLTYTSMQGAHLIGEESYLLGIAGSYKPDDGYIRCIYTSDNKKWLPAFCNIIQAKSSLININNAQISEKGSLRMVGDEVTPAELDYQIAVSPDSGGASSSSTGTVKTEFAGSVMEARDNTTNVSATNQWKDATEVTGGIQNFQKHFTYMSGLRL